MFGNGTLPWTRKKKKNVLLLSVEVSKQNWPCRLVEVPNSKSFVFFFLLKRHPWFSGLQPSTMRIISPLVSNSSSTWDLKLLDFILSSSNKSLIYLLNANLIRKPYCSIFVSHSFFYCHPPTAHRFSKILWIQFLLGKRDVGYFN